MLRINQVAIDQSVARLPAHETITPLIQSELGMLFMALSLTIVHRGEVLLNQAWGWIDPDTQQYPVTPATLFDLASITKLFTVSAFLRLVSEGKTGLDAPLPSIIPEFAAISPRSIDGGQDPHTKATLPTPEDRQGKTIDPHRVTFRHLLTHTSGLAPWRDVYHQAGNPPVVPGEIDPVGREIRWSRAVEALCRYPFVGEPGDCVRYSDLGLMLLGEAVSRLCGASLDVAIDTLVAKPLGLHATMFNPVQHGIPRTHIPPTEIDPTWRKRRVWGEVHDENACGVGGVAGHAGLFSTSRDVAVLGQAWLERDPRLGIDVALMDEAVREQVVTNGERRGLGWVIKPHEKASAGDLLSANTFGHTGFVGNSLWVDPDRQLVAACLTNNVYFGRHTADLYPFRRALHTALAEMVDGL